MTSQTDEKHPDTSPDEESPHHLEQQRRENRAEIASLGVNPCGERSELTDTIVPCARAMAMYDESADTTWQDAQKQAKESGEPVTIDDPRPVATVSGRIMLRRPTGKLVWLNLRDHSGDVQVAVSKRDCDESGFGIAKSCDLGDVVVARGPVMKTRTGEVTVWSSELCMGVKSLAPPPEKFKGLKDHELRYRRRYIDMYANPETMRTLTMRSRIVSRMRKYLESLEFIEVETPVLQMLAGGAAARPFVTHMNALDIDLFMRIAPELYLKRLLVGGMPRVFEFSRNFRNEGLSKQHNPEFTSIELYQAFGDYESMREITEGLIRDAAAFVAQQTGHDASAMPFGDLTIDYERPFDRVTFAELFEKALGFPMTDHERALREAQSRGFRTTGDGGAPLDPVLVVNELFEEVAENEIDPSRPTFVFDYPAALSPLTRPKSDDPSIAERWDIFIGGMEIGPAYTELNDPDVQESKFREQLAGIDDEESTFRTFDEDFINALKVGMPPAGGMGVGVDRLCMLLLDQPTIRDVLCFPFMRPE